MVNYLRIAGGASSVCFLLPETPANFGQQRVLELRYLDAQCRVDERLIAFIGGPESIPLWMALHYPYLLSAVRALPVIAVDTPIARHPAAAAAFPIRHREPLRVRQSLRIASRDIGNRDQPMAVRTT